MYSGGSVDCKLSQMHCPARTSKSRHIVFLAVLGSVEGANGRSFGHRRFVLQVGDATGRKRLKSQVAKPLGVFPDAPWNGICESKKEGFEYVVTRGIVKYLTPLVTNTHTNCTRNI